MSALSGVECTLLELSRRDRWKVDKSSLEIVSMELRLEMLLIQQVGSKGCLTSRAVVGYEGLTHAARALL